MSANYDALVDGCYAAVADEGLWPRALDEVAAAVGALGLVVMAVGLTNRTLASESLSEANAAYAAGWWHLDPRAARAASAVIRPGNLVRDHDLISAEEQRRDVFFQDFCRPHRLGEFASYAAPDTAGGLLSVGAFRRIEDGGYEADHLALLRRLAPHVARAYTLTATLAQARATGNELPVLGDAGFGTILLGPNGHVHGMNAAAESLMKGRLQPGPGGALQAVLPSERDRFERAVVTQLLGTGSSVLMLRGAPGLRPVSVEVVSLRQADVAEFPGAAPGARVLVVLRDVFGRAEGSIEPLLVQLGVTPAEARVAMLVGRGLPPDKVAHRLAVSADTVRSQLRAVYAKLNLKRQSELAGLVTRLDERWISP